MTDATEALAQQRLHMVNSQLRTSEVVDPAVLEAFLKTPRESFVAPALVKLAYLDTDILSAGSKSRRLLAPLTLARLLQAAEVAPGERVLDVGGGAGYCAALLSHMGAKVWALETSDAGVAEAVHGPLAGVEVVTGDLSAGAPDKAPFDVIVINGAFETTPSALIAQLALGGRLVGVDSRVATPRGVLIERSASGMSERSLFDATAPVLEAFRRAPSFAF